jgi:hypothetical protein
MRKLMTLIAIGACLVLWAAAARADDVGDRLVVVQDESSMERIIERNLIEKHKLTVNEKFAKPDDLYLVVPMKGDPMPPYHFTIDTQVANKDDNTGRITERAVLVELNTEIKVPEDKWVAVMRLLNNLNRGKIFASAYVDSDGEIILGWNLNVMSDGLPVEYVYDAVAREDKLWREIYADIKAALQ